MLKFGGLLIDDEKARGCRRKGLEPLAWSAAGRMFPVLNISITGLDSDASYSLMVDMECVDSKRYRYSFHQSKWTATGPATPQRPASVNIGITVALTNECTRRFFCTSALIARLTTVQNICPPGQSGKRLTLDEKQYFV
ncbi:T-box [Teladorsagia circumcincta]|uniref:T-box n=1 Tax=Teladorsagia circumcincta TaxID=45464 RepID=A0A2G9TRZ7_TELCI|nr:T-box [Teladorsagia circumcincta]